MNCNEWYHASVTIASWPAREVHKWAILLPYPISSTDLSNYSYIYRSPFIIISKPSLTKFVKFINESLAYKYVRYICNGIIIIEKMYCLFFICLPVTILTAVEHF